MQVLKIKEGFGNVQGKEKLRRHIKVGGLWGRGSNASLSLMSPEITFSEVCIIHEALKVGSEFGAERGWFLP